MSDYKTNEAQHQTEYKFTLFKRKQPIFKCVRPLLKLIYKKPKEIVYLADKFVDKTIIVSNHCSKKGPMILELHLPVFNAKWGAYEMLGNYNSRFHYLRDVYYMQKKGCKKFISTIRAGFEAIFSASIYKGMKMLPSYPDARLLKTLRWSMEVLDSNAAVMIFPENSNNGYKEELTEFFPGFVLLAEKYFKAHGEDVPITPIYYNDSKRVVFVGKQYFLQDFVKQGLDRYQIAEEFRKIVNNLFYMSCDYKSTKSRTDKK